MSTLGSQVSVVAMVCNEEYWIDLVLRPILGLQVPLYIADCASQDNTPNIISAMQRDHDFYFERHKHLTPQENGLIRGQLAQRASTPWILQVDGDELWIREKLEECLSLDLCELDGFHTGFVHVHNILWQDGQFILADGISQHRLHRKDAEWLGEYPFESTTDFGEKALYFEGGPHAYHTRYLQRSSCDNETYMRVEKQKYFDPSKRSWDKPVDLFGELGLPRYYNPYVERQ